MHLFSLTCVFFLKFDQIVKYPPAGSVNFALSGEQKFLEQESLFFDRLEERYGT